MLLIDIGRLLILGCLHKSIGHFGKLSIVFGGQENFGLLLK